MTWHKQASCRPGCLPEGTTPEDFFPFTTHPGNNEAAYERALAVCATCTVRRECLTDVMTEPMGVGVWGGLKLRNDGDRRFARRQLREGLV